jgi:Flp pilus assembly protein TadD
MGDVMSEMGPLVNAMRYYRKARELSPDDPEPPLMEANALLGEGDSRHALPIARCALRLALARKPRDVVQVEMAFDVLAGSLLAEKRYEAARRLLVQGIRVTGSDILGCLLGRIHEGKGADRVAGARRKGSGGR